MTNNDTTHHLMVAIPSIPYGPVGIPEAAADADYYRAAARNIRHAKAQGNAFAGSNLTESVAKLCEAAAEALDATQRATASRPPANGIAGMAWTD